MADGDQFVQFANAKDSDSPAMHDPMPFQVGIEGEPGTAPDRGVAPRRLAPAGPFEPRMDPAVFFAGLAVGMGVLAGLGVAALYLQYSKPSGPYDLGALVYPSNGLRAHLFTQWQDRVHYRLTVEPSDASGRPGFALAAMNGRQTPSFSVLLSGADGTLLCSKNIAMNFDPAQAAATAAAAGEPVDKLIKTEAADGQVVGIVAEGEIGCPRKAYESISSWSLSTDFPTLGDQQASLKNMFDLEVVQNASASAAEDAAESQKAAAALKAAAARRKPRKEAVKAESFYIEGDDAVVGFDSAHGWVETSAGKWFELDKATALASADLWQDYPVNVHYRCDQAEVCSITARGGGVLSARLRR